MNFFEQELQRIVSPIRPDATYVGRACYVPLGKGVVAKLEFVTYYMDNQYRALQMSTFNSRGGAVDVLVIDFEDFFGRDQIGDFTVQYIGANNFEYQWRVQATEKNYAAMREAVANYLSVFQTQGQTMEQSDAPNCQQTMPL